MSDQRPTAYPLQWPVGRPRATSRTWAAFGSMKGTGPAGGPAGRERLTIAQGADRLVRALSSFGAREVVISTNVEVSLAGLPKSNSSAPADPGVAVYFRLHGQPHCLACDKWTRVADNLAAVAKHVDSIRGQLRWGAVEENQVFANVRLLAAVGVAKKWWEILGVSKNAGLDEIERAHEKLIRRSHPDVNATDAAKSNYAAEINAARDDAYRERGL